MGGAPGGFGGVTTEKCSPGRVWSGELAVWGALRGGIEGAGRSPTRRNGGFCSLRPQRRRSRRGLRLGPALCRGLPRKEQSGRWKKR